MKICLFGSLLISVFMLHAQTASATYYEAVSYYEQNSEPIADAKFKLVKYKPLTQQECKKVKDKIGLKYCPTNIDYLAGAALACDGLWNLPQDLHLKKLAQRLYTEIRQVGNTTYFGARNDKLMKEWNIYSADKQIYYWLGEEAGKENAERGYARMFGIYASIPYYVTRDGSSYKENTLLNDEEYVMSLKTDSSGGIEKFKDPSVPVLAQKNKEELVTLCYDTEKN